MAASALDSSPPRAGSPSLRSRLNGIAFAALLAAVATQIAAWPGVARFGLSPLIVGIAVGLLYGNVLKEDMHASWADGIAFAARRLLRIAVAFYGLRISFQEIAQVGAAGLAVSVVMVVGTLALGSWLGVRVFKLDRDTALLTAAGSAICGAAAVLAFESALRSKPHKSAVAVGSVVLFGTLSMFLYPFAWRAGWLPLDAQGVGLFFGGTIHEVAQVVGAASAVSPEAAHVATIVKMTRVALLVPVLLALTAWSARGGDAAAANCARRLPIPWFAVGFLALVWVNSLDIIPTPAVRALNAFDTFALTTAMTALGIETRIAQIRQAGVRPLLMGGALYVWLVVGGYAAVRVAQHYWA